jgi:bifunctional oligoribonuclease and PAP phosphatase NrnA
MPRSIVLQAIIHAFRSGTRFFLAGHRRPDGDSIAAQLVIASLLRRMGKQAAMYTADPIPHNLMFLPGIARIHHKHTVSHHYDVACIIECSGQDRMGNIINLNTQAGQVINIDHNTQSNLFGDINYIDAVASSSCEMVDGLFRAAGIALTYDEAVCLYAGIMTDTGCFRHANTTAHVHKLIGQYIALGVKPAAMYRHIYQQKNARDLKLWGKILSGMTLCRRGTIALLSLPKTTADTEDVINFGMMIRTVDAAVLVQPISTQKTRVSLRSRGEFDVGKLAVHFGGGGHKNAAGCTLPYGIARSRQLIIAEVNKIMR